MKTLRTPGLLVALGLASAALAQDQATPIPADPQSAPQPMPAPDPDSASSPHQRDVTSQPAIESVPAQSPDPSAASTPHQQEAVGGIPRDDAEQGGAPRNGVGSGSKLLGLEVESPTGQLLGSVIDMVLDSSGEPAYVVISTGTDTATAVPYAAVSPMVRNNRIVLDRTRLQNSPQVTQADIHDKANTKWRMQADRYWGQGTIRSATPGTDDTQKPKDR